MGGLNSGRYPWLNRKTTVEECLALGVDKLRRDRLLYEPPENHYVPGSLTWHNIYNGEKMGSVDYRVVHAGDWLVLWLDYRIGDLPLKTPIRLQTTPQRLGGKRWWFTCPLGSQGKPYRRRVGKLYLPPGAHHFGCRHCHDLTYTSCQESHKYDRIYRYVAKDMGISFEGAKNILGGK